MWEALPVLIVVALCGLLLCGLWSDLMGLRNSSTPEHRDIPQWRDPSKPRPKLPEGYVYYKPYKAPSGWVNLHVRREVIDKLGKTSVKRCLAPAAIVNALFEMFAGWDEETRAHFVWEHLTHGTPETSKEPPEIIYLSYEWFDNKEPDMKSNLRVEQLEARDCPAVLLPSAVVDGDTLNVKGTNASETIRVHDDDGDGIINVAVNDVDVQVQGVADKTLIELINVKGKKGDDTIIISNTIDVRDVNGVLVDSADTRLDGGDGDDVLNPLNGGIVGGLLGVDANGVVVGEVVGNSAMFGKAGDDLLISGRGNDTMDGGNGNDIGQWDEGTLTDKWKGGKGYDVFIVNGNDGGADGFNLVGKGGGALFTRDNTGGRIQFAINIKTTEQVNLNTLGGDDIANIGNLDKSKIQVVNADGGDGTDTANVAAQNEAVVNLANIEIANVDAVFALMGQTGK